MDDSKERLPQYLRFVRGIIDSEEETQSDAAKAARLL
jgi:hypothetical protein